MSNNSRDLAMVEVAKRKAAVIGFLNTKKGWHGSSVIAEATGVDRKDTTYVVNRLSKSGLVESKKVKGVWLFSTESSPDFGVVEVNEPQLKKSKHVKAAKDLELVIGGVMIVVGRNEQTGRLRITITED